MIKEHDLHYILVAKPGDHQFLFEQIHLSGDAVYHEITKEDRSYHLLLFVNNVSLNKSNPELKVNVLEYRCTNSKGKEVTFSWVTDITLSTTNILQIAKSGRARWKIENETFDTLKNLGYNFSHSYDHGKRYLSTVFCMLMMLAFLIDQVQEICCALSRKCKRVASTYRNLWKTMRAFFRFSRLYN